MYCLYVLKSEKDFGYYIGITDNVEQRLKQHNQGKTKSIKHRTPFILVHFEEFENRTDATKRENQLKRNYQIRTEMLKKLGFNVK